MRIRCAVRLSLLFQCSRHTHTIAVGRMPHRNVRECDERELAGTGEVRRCRRRLFWSEIWRKSCEHRAFHSIRFVQSFSILFFVFLLLFFFLSSVFDGMFVFHSRMLHTLRSRRTHICVGVSQLCTIVADVGCVFRHFNFRLRKVTKKVKQKKKTFRFCFPIPNHKPTDSAASTHTLTPAGTYKLKNPHIYPHPILPRLRLAQMLFCRTSFTFCLCTFFFLPVCVCLHSIFHFTFHSTLPVLLVSTTSENFVLFRFTAAFNLGECVCVHHLYSVRVSCLRFCRLHRSTFIIEILFLVCFAFLCSLDCNQVAHSQWV